MTKKQDEVKLEKDEATTDKLEQDERTTDKLEDVKSAEGNKTQVCIYHLSMINVLTLLHTVESGY